VPGDPDNDQNVEHVPYDPEVLPRTPEEYAGVYRRKLEEAEHAREQLLEWVSNAYDFDAKFRNEFSSWLSGFDLSDLRTGAALEAWADRLDVPGQATKVGTLLLQVQGLAGRVRGLDIYR
jgi:hypothetical protein